MPELTARRRDCPTDLDLEALWLREPPAVERHASHVAACPDCAARLEWMGAAEVRFHQEVYPATVAAVTASVRPPARRARLAWLAAIPAAAMLALLVRTDRQPPDGYVGAKGSPVALEVFTREEGATRRLADGDRVSATAGLRFVARAPGKTVLLLTVDGSGKVSRLQPPAGAAPGAADGLLPGGALLDGVPGPERIHAIFLDPGAPLDEVERSAREAYAGGGAERVRTLPRLPIAAAQESLLLEKVERPR